MDKRRGRAGFTLIELMVVVAIIALLASIVVPKFADMVTRAKEASVKGSVGAVRSAISIFYADHEGVWPTMMPDDLIANSKYLPAMPSITIPAVSAQDNPGHPPNNGVAGLNLGATGTAIDVGLCGGMTPCMWVYDGGGGTGVILIACTHLDTQGIPWTTY